MFQWVYSLYKINFQQMLCDVYTFFLCLCFFFFLNFADVGLVKVYLLWNILFLLEKSVIKHFFLLSRSLSCKDFTCNKDEVTNFIYWFFNDSICWADVYCPSVKPSVPIMSAIFLSVFLSGFLVTIINREGLLFCFCIFTCLYVYVLAKKWSTNFDTFWP